MADEGNGTAGAGTVDGAGGDTGTSSTPGSAGAGGTLILGKYKTQADLEKAHQEQERTLSQKSGEAAAYRDRLEQLEGKLLALEDDGTLAEAPTKPRDRKQILEEFAQDPEGYMAARERAIEERIAARFGQTEEQLSRLEARAAIRDVSARHSDFGKYQASMVQIAKETNIRDPERLYQLAKYPDVERSLEERITSHRKEIDTLRAQAYADGGGIPQPKQSKEDEAIADAIVNAGRRRPSPFI